MPDYLMPVLVELPLVCLFAWFVIRTQSEERKERSGMTDRFLASLEKMEEGRESGVKATAEAVKEMALSSQAIASGLESLDRTLQNFGSK